MQNTNELLEKQEDSESQVKQQRKPRIYSEQVLPSNRHTFSVHFEVLKRFVTHGRNGTSSTSVEGEGIPIQAAQMNVRFMRSIGLLNVTGRGLYAPTPETIQFINARSVSDEKARPILAQLIRQTWFYELAQTVFQTTGTILEESFIGELALAAKTDKNKEQTALKTILEYLVYSGIIIRDERGLTWGTERAPQSSETITENIPSMGSMPLIEPRGGEKPQTETIGWHVLQTEDFYLRIRSDTDAVEDLIIYLGTLKRKMERVKSNQSKMEAIE